MLNLKPNLQRSTPNLSTSQDMCQRDTWKTSSTMLFPKSNTSLSRTASMSPKSEGRGGSTRTCTTNLEAPECRFRRSRTVSPRHNRSLSSRSMRRPTSQSRQGDSKANEFRSRGATMPSESARELLARRRMRSNVNSTSSPPIHEPGNDDDNDEDGEYYLLRIFTINSKGGIVNGGDFVKQRSRSSNSMSAAGSAKGNVTSGASNATSYSSGGQGRGPKYRVVILGSMGVGKTALVEQFMTSEYMNQYETQDDDMEKCVSILLDGMEYELLFSDDSMPVENPDGEFIVEDSDAYVVVYSVTERRSFEKAVDILFGMRAKGLTYKKAVILVGNKSDLARSREVAIEEGKSIASSYECKFIETSACINHNVDELLVGIVSQIRLKLKQRQEKKKRVLRHL